MKIVKAVKRSTNLNLEGWLELVLLLGQGLLLLLGWQDGTGESSHGLNLALAVKGVPHSHSRGKSTVCGKGGGGGNT